MPKSTWIVALCVALAAGTLATAQEPGDAQKAITGRIETLEKTVLRDPFHPEDTVLSRLDAVEATLKNMDRDGRAAAKAEVKTDEQVRRSLDMAQGDIKTLAERLKRIEDSHRRQDATDSASDLRELKTSLSQLARTVSDLQERVRKLETRK